MKNDIKKFRFWDGKKMHDVSNDKGCYYENFFVIDGGGQVLYLYDNGYDANNFHEDDDTVPLQYVEYKDDNNIEIYEQDIINEYKDDILINSFVVQSITTFILYVSNKGDKKWIVAGNTFQNKI